MTTQRRPMGMTAFIIIWIGQVVSLLGTAMSNFALTIWAYQETGQATALALVGFFFMVPLLVFSPIAGALVDRSNRKLMMMISDLGAGLVTIIQLALFATGNLEIWHLYITAAIAGTFQTFQWPAFSAALTMMVPKEQYGRANGMMQLAGSASNIFAPILAAALLGFIGLAGILTIDIITFVFAVGALLFVFIPQPEVTDAGRESKGSIWKESAYGFRYIRARPSLLGLQLVFTVANFFATLGFTLVAPMILARTGNNELALGTTQSAGAVGGVIGGLVMSAWGGPKRMVHGVFLGWIIAGLFGETLMGLGQGVPVWAVASFIFAFFGPVINASNQAIWQAKTEPDVQGRVFSVRRMIAWLVVPLAQLLAGPLADQVFEPAMSSKSWLSETFSWVVGFGPGAGMALIVIFAGIGAALSGLSGYAFRNVRDVEALLPDHEVVAEGAPAPS